MIPRGETTRGQTTSRRQKAPHGPERSPIRAAFVALRPRQWVKNLLLFGGIIFAAEVDDPSKWLQAFAAFALYCAASSAAYLVNDLRDVEADRTHPVKHGRPIARGELRPRIAGALVGALLAVAFALAAWLGSPSVLCLFAFVVLQTAYSIGLKNVVLIDVLAIAALFVIRAVAGAIAVDVRISPWLLVCTGLLALFLALGKRRAELLLVEAERTPGRRVLAGYSPAVLDRLLVAVAFATAVVYVLYTLTARDSYALVLTVPFVIFGLGRYLHLVRESDRGEEPENVLLGDTPILITVAAWAALCAAILIQT
ncbi:decaprenyl-phosphate phosphoribosyltransferase [Gaiella sp.]|uniref:decaprenyl-phosphate phosphoribosyltransferase n=1 Tax=Gaiella sp. TaxID=2663207 RepID=UPI003983CC94